MITSTTNTTNRVFSHGTIAMLDSFLRMAIAGQQETFPLSAALNSSCKLKAVLPARIYKRGELVAVKKLPMKEIKQMNIPFELV